MEEIKHIPIGLTREEWKQVGAYANSLIQNDMAEGKFQTPSGNCSKPNYNLQYAKYKANAMRRLTKGGKLLDFDPSHDYMGKRLYGKKKKVPLGKGKRISGLYAKHIESTQTAFVDMTLTGHLKNSLMPKKWWEHGVECGYDPAENAKGKILGNRRYGREVLGLSDKNINLVKEFITDLMRKRIANFNQQINIEVRF